MIEFTKKPVYTFDGTDYPTLEAAQIAAIGAIHPTFARLDAGKVIPDEVCKIILANAAELTAIFKQSPRVRSSPRPKKRAKPAAPAT